MKRLSVFAVLLLVGCGEGIVCDGESCEDLELGDLGLGDQDEALVLRRGDNSPLPCADPTVVSEKDREQTWFVYCTSLNNVWRTRDWRDFTNVGDDLRFDLSGMPPASRQKGQWWAPSVSYDRGTDRYVMWVSVIDGQDFRQDTRSLAVFTAPTPTGTWTFRRFQKNANQAGQMYIDPSMFRNHNGNYFLYWKQYGPGIKSSIMGARLDERGTDIVDGTAVEIMDGYGGPGTWEDNCRENPSVWQNPSTGRWHMLFSGGSWRDGTYATGHAVSSCGPLCVRGEGNWHIKPSTDRGVGQVVQARNLNAFDHGGPGGAVWQGKDGRHIIYAAAFRSRQGDHTRYLFRERVSWSEGAPYVDTARHNPRGF